MAKGRHYQVVYTWPDGREEIRYTRPVSDLELAREVRRWRRRWRGTAEANVYSLRRVA